MKNFLDRIRLHMDHSSCIYNAIQSTLCTKKFKSLTELINFSRNNYSISLREYNRYNHEDLEKANKLDLPSTFLLLVDPLDLKKQLRQTSQNSNLTSEIRDNMQIINNTSIVGVVPTYTNFNKFASKNPYLTRVLEIFFDYLKQESSVVQKQLGITYRYRFNEKDKIETGSGYNTKTSIHQVTISDKIKIIITLQIEPLSAVAPQLESQGFVINQFTDSELVSLERRENELMHEIHAERELECVFALERQIEKEQEWILEYELETARQKEIERVQQLERMRAHMRNTERKLESQRQYIARERLRSMQFYR